MKYIKLIRLPNLLILAMGMYMLRLMAVEPMLILSRNAPQVSSMEFLFLVLSVVFIAAGGYVINDIEDADADSINKPGKVIIGNTVTSDQGWNIYIFLTFAGILTGFWLTFSHQVKYIAYVNLVAAGLLYFYSTTYKGMILIGNIMVAALSAFSLAIVYLSEPVAPKVEPLKIISTGYVVFAFLTSMVREIVKDMEDIKGDDAAGYRTLPVVAGITISRMLAAIITLLTLGLLIYIQILTNQWDAVISFVYVVALIEIPLVLLTVAIFAAREQADFARCSMLSKMIMLTGILSLPVFYYTT